MQLNKVFQGVIYSCLLPLGASQMPPALLRIKSYQKHERSNFAKLNNPINHAINVSRNCKHKTV
ncbi:MAG: hypothetical protein ABW032_10440, partial [Burkholderiaceae bacterium]